VTADPGIDPSNHSFILMGAPGVGSAEVVSDNPSAKLRFFSVVPILRLSREQLLLGLMPGKFWQSKKQVANANFSLDPRECRHPVEP
jgi:hypothetical protein